MGVILLAATLTQSVTRTMRRIIFYQAMMVTAFVLMLWVVKDVKSAGSALTGSMAYWLPTLFFTCTVATCASAHRVKRFMLAFFVGEIFKLVVCGTLFLLAILYLPVQLVDAVFGLVAAIVAFWIASIVCLWRTGVGS